MSVDWAATKKRRPCLNKIALKDNSIPEYLFLLGVIKFMIKISPMQVIVLKIIYLR